MKQGNFICSCILISSLVSLISISKMAQATSQLNQPCPQKFIAKVLQVKELGNSGFPKVEVDFKVIQMLEGNQMSSKKIQVVRDGPLQFVHGETYMIESHESWLCSASLYSQI